MTSAIVTGATGFVGAHLVKELQECGVEVTAFCRKGSANLSRLPPKTHVEYSSEKLPSADVFYHLAWQDASGPGRADPMTQIGNAELTLRLLDLTSKLGCAKFVALGTVYENLSSQVTSSGAFGGSDFYILSKAYAHTMSDKYARKLSLDYTWCTVCHPIGEYVKVEQMLASVISRLLNGEPVNFGQGAEYYDIVAVEDLARGLRLAGYRNAKRREYFIGSGQPRTLREYLTEVKRILKVKTLILFGARPDDDLHFDKSWFDIAPLSADTGYTPAISFDEAVVRTANYGGEL
jgi:nucleoside-diphosphate-sugar epimerase